MKRLFTAIFLFVVGCGGSVATSTEPQSPIYSTPNFSLPSLDGKTVQLSDYLGKNVILIDFWSTTCDPCLAEMPHLVDLYNGNKERGFVVLAISLDGPESRNQVSNVVHEKGMTFPVLLDEETTVVAQFNPKREMPFSVLIGRDGSILHRHSGYTPGDETALASEIEEALK